MPDPRAEIWASRHGLWSRSPPSPDSKTPHDRYVLGEVADRLAVALRGLVDRVHEWDGIGQVSPSPQSPLGQAEAALAEYGEKSDG